MKNFINTIFNDATKQFNSFLATLGFLLLLLLSSNSFGQAIYLNDFQNGTAANPFINTPVTPTAISGSSFTTTGPFTLERGIGNAFSALSVSDIGNAGSYTLKFNVAIGFALSVTSFDLWRYSNSAGNTISSIIVNNTTITSAAISIPTGGNAGSGQTLLPTNVATPISGLTGTITVVINFGGALNGSFRLDDFTLNGNVVSQPVAPVLITPTAIVTATTAATLGATITNNGGSAVTARGTVWKAAASGVTITDNKLAEGGISVAAFSHSRTVTSPQTQYVYAGYATNVIGTSLSPEATFRTWSNPATVQPSTFTTTSASTSLVANWSTATFPGGGATQAGYALIYATGTPTLSSLNGNAPAAGVGTLINIAPTVLPVTPALSTVLTGLINGTLYNLLIIPYTWDGINASTYNYFTTAARITTGTPQPANYVWSGGTTGTWDTAANWTPIAQIGGPDGGDTVTFNTGGNVSVTNVPTVSLGRITVSNTGTAVTLTPASGAAANTITLSNAASALNVAAGTVLNITGNTAATPTTLTVAFSGAGNTATIAGAVNLLNPGLDTANTACGNYNATNSTTSVSGVFSRSSNCSVLGSTISNLIFNTTGAFQLKGIGSSPPTANWNAGSTLEFNNSFTGGTITITNLAQSFSNVTLNAPSLGATGVIDFAGGISSIGGNLTVTSTGTGSVIFNSTAAADIVTVGGLYNQTGGTINLATATGTTTMNVAGSGTSTISGGTLNLNGTAASNPTLAFTSPTGNFTQSGGTINLHNGYTANGASLANFTVGGNFTQTAGTFEFATSATTSNTATSRLNVAGTFSRSGTATSMQTTGGTFNGFVTMNGGATQSISITSATAISNFIYYDINPGSTTALLSNLPSSVVNINAGGTLNCGTFLIQDSNTISSFTNNGTLGIGSPNGITSGTTLSGNVQGTGTRTYTASSNYVYNGSTNQVTGNGLPTPLTGTLTIANTGTAPSNVVTLSRSTTAAGTVNLTDGALDVNGTALTLNSAAAQSVAGSGANAFTISSTATNGIVATTGSGAHTISLSGFGTTASGGLIIGANTTLQMNSNAELNVGGNGTSTSMLTVAGRLLMNSITNSTIALNTAPFYSNTGTLEYAVTRGPLQEWLAGTALSTAGVPQNVTINGVGITVSMPTSDRSALGNLTITNGTLAQNVTSGNLFVGGNWLRQNSSTTIFTNNGRTVTFNGAAAQTIQVTGTGTNKATFGGLAIANTLGGVSLSSPVDVSLTLAFTSGILTTTSTNILSMLNTISGTVTGGSITSFVNGPMNRTLAANLAGTANTFNFPLGNGTTYLPLTLTNPTTGVTGPILQVTAVNAASGGSVTGALTSISTTEYWQFFVVSGAFTNGAVTISRQTALGILSTIGRSTTLAGAYSDIGGTASGTTINGVASAIGAIGSTNSRFFVMATTIASPSITSFSPTSGFAGSTVVITGTAFTNASAITFGATAAASYIVNSATQITAVVGAGATGTVAVTTSGGTGTSSGSFTFNGYITNTDGDWNTPATWLNNSVPPIASTTTVAHLITINGTVINAPNTITINATKSLTFGAIGAITVNNTVANNGSVVMTAGGALNMASGAALANGSNTFTAGAGTIAFAAAGTVSGTITFNKVTVAGAVDFGATSTIGAAGSLQINLGGSVLNNAPIYNSTSTLIYNSGTAYGRSTEWSATIGKGFPGNVTIQNNTILDLSVNGSADRGIAGNLNLGLTGQASAGSLSMGATANKLSVAGNVIIGGNTTGISTLTLSSVASGDLYVQSNWTLSTNGVFVPSNRAVFFSGAASQTLTGVTTFDILRMAQSPSSTLTLNNNINIAQNIVFNTGKIVTGVNTVIMNNTATASSGESVNSYIFGKQQWNFSAASTRFYSVGDATVYAGVDINYTTVGVAGPLIVSTAPGDQATISTSSLDNTKSVNRTYTLATPNALAGTYTATFNFVAGDLDGSAATANLLVGNYNGSTWTYPTVGTRAATSTQATGITTFGDFQLAECKSVVLTITNPATVCSPATVNLTAAAVTAGSTPSGSLTFTYFTDAAATITLASPATMAIPGTYYIKATSTSGCTAVRPVVITIPPGTVGGTLSADQNICATTTPANITLAGQSGNILKWQSANNSSFTSAVDIANTTTTLILTPVSATTYYRVVVQNGSCSVANSTTAAVNIRTATYSGVIWSELPTATTALVIASNYLSTGDLEGCSCLINPGVTATINTSHTLTLKDALTNNSGTVTFENGSSLLQISNTVNIGNIIYKRNTAIMSNNFDFTYWSSPVANKQLGRIWMSANSADTFYSWSGATSTWTPHLASFQMIAGTGYIARSRNGGVGTDFSGAVTTFNPLSPWLAKFSGVPNNGNISFAVSGSGANVDNLMGNPYPSALDITAFSNDPSNSAKLTGNFYFWTATTAISGNAYSPSDYALFNAKLNAGTRANLSSPIPDRYVDAGQGFFADGASTGTVTFKNSHRVAGNNLAFFRTSANNGTQVILESSKLWLNLTNTQGLFKQQLITYTQGATMGYDPTLDAKTFDGNSYIDFYSNAAAEKFTIQSRATPFVTSDLVPLGFKTSVAGAYTITIDHKDGLFTTQTVFLQDNLLNIDHNLSAAPYNFTTATGTFDSRFVLKYTSTTLGLDNPISNLSDLIVAKVDNNLKIKSNQQNIDKVIVFDLLGRKVFEQTNINNSEFQTKNIVLNQQTLIVKVVLENGVVVSRKIVF